mmetsp:Transcript_66963/g.187171  ORF Transcript_66963/g.187171 Transcript_66963/m.187171 type:complete len:525 (-) Transcript_66963:45-1619(-)|eukprot:CAMPEP_0176229688 /NCGR_PEP_ID=MMETSP0121_2-20121125/23917_1 /TAXON_ID=160619 /ORGANISM="Kryptoperidinium foliaceum, Strain CCMP 1326" /LENGTH=524 /DNA_ID=CAMNT_0017569017 /DNA_START=60 /DNA_END=1634 /DNA_ORIENTATION=-
MTTASVESADVIRLILQFCKENGLHRTLQTLQEESRVSLNTVDSLDGLMGDINHGRWDIVLQAVSYLSMPDAIMQDLYIQIILELAEVRETDLAQQLLRETAPMMAMKQETPERYLRLEALLKKSYFDPREAYDGLPKEKRRSEVAQAMGKHISVAPPSRLLVLVGQAMKWQQHAGILPANARIDVFRGVAADVVEEREQCPTMIAKKVKFGEKSHPECACFSPDGQYCVSGSVDGFVEVWDYQTAMLRKDLSYQEEGSFMMHEKAVIAVAFSRDSDLLATGSQDGQLKVWRVASGQCVRRYEKAHNEGITYIAWSKDSSQILTASFDSTARAHGLKSGKTLKEYRGHTSYVNSAVYTRDGAKVITGSSDGHVMVFDAKTTEQISVITPPPPPHLSSTMHYSVNAALVAPQPPGQAGDSDDAMIFVCTRTNVIQMMNLQGQVLKSFSSGRREKGDFVGMVLSPKGEWLYAVGEDHKLYCFSIASGALEQTLKVADKEVIGLTHHPSRNVVAAFASDGTLAFLRP